METLDQKEDVLKTIVNRSRVKTDTYDNIDAIHYVSGGFVGDFVREPYTSYRRYSRIDDWSRKRRDRDGLWPPSDTVQLSFDATGLQPVVPWVQYGGEFPAAITPTGQQLPHCTESEVFNFPFVSDEDWQNFAEEAFRAFSTQIPTSVSIANFAWELQELGDLIPKLENSIQSAASGAFLRDQFGWKPFLQDLQTLGGLLNTVNSKIKFLKDTYGKKTRLGLYKPNVVEPLLGFLSPWSFVINTHDSPNRVETWLPRSYRCDLRAGGYLFHLLQDLDSFYGFSRALLVSLGLDNPVRAVWQAIPYSFVADWFTGLSSKLGILSVNPFKGEWSVSDFSSSALAYCEWEVFQTIETTQFISLGRVKARRYERISRLPVRSSYLTLNTLTPQQLLLTSAMLAQH